MELPHKGGISVVGLVGPFLGLDKAALYDLAHHHFKGLAVAFIQRQQKARQHGKHHKERRRTGGDAAPDQQEKRDTDQQRTAKTKELAFRQPEYHLGFHLGKILGDSDISQIKSPRFSCGQGKIAVHFVAPHIPARDFLSGKQFCAGQVARKLDDFLAGDVGFLAVFLNGGNNKLMDASGIAFGVSPLGKQADFRISSCPVSQPVKPGGAFLVSFEPYKGHGLEGEAPRLDQPQGFRQHGERSPQKQQAVLGGQGFHRQGTQRVDSHGGIVVFRCPLYRFLVISPRRVSVNNVIGFLLRFLDKFFPPA